MRKILGLIIVVFVVFCGVLVFESGLFKSNCKQKPGCILLQQTAEENNSKVAVKEIEEESYQLKAPEFAGFGADNAAAKTLQLGSTDAESGFKFELELSTKGAAVRKATFSEFNDRDPNDPQPLTLLSPVQLTDGSELLSMANKNFVFVNRKLQLPLGQLHWQSGYVEKKSDGSQSTSFEAIIKDNATGKPVVKLTKTYRVVPDSYQVDCSLTVENLSVQEQKVRFDLTGPLGLAREGLRSDMRSVVAGFSNAEGQINSALLNSRKLRKAKTDDDRRLSLHSDTFLWIAATNKYFTAILRPMPDEGKQFCDWVKDKTGAFYNPDGDAKADSGDETIGADLRIAEGKLAAAGDLDDSRTYNFQLFLLPKDKRLFDKTDLFRELGFFHTITFMPCFCCPASIIYPLAFGILALMEWMYNFIPNYGVVIIILVFIIRIVIHPLTKKSQVSMSKMTKLAPMAEEIKKKYANNKTEMNKQLMALYKKQGASPIMGMLPMMVQMPIWIALYSAIYASISLRGAAFLPFWITDLSAPDALFSFSTVTIPLLGWKINSFNLLPIMMGVAFYLQQKLMPKQASAATNPQVAQQQKMMIMMPIMFPLMLYKAPSGLNLYIMASTFAGVIEQYIIRKHIREKEQAEAIGLVAATSKTGGKVKKKKPKPFYKTNR